MLKQMVDETDEDTLSVYLKLAGGKILSRAYPYGTSETEVPLQYATLQLEIAAFMLNKRGAEGQVGHGENGVQRQYEDGDVPPSMLRSITPHCKVIG